MKLNPKGLGLAFTVTASVFYVGCILLMQIVTPKALVLFFNSILHGLDIEAIVMQEVGWVLSLLGLVNAFVLSWLTGTLTAMVYNLTA